MSSSVYDGRFLVTARHDYMDSVWDVWVARWNSTEGDWFAGKHTRLKVDGKHEAVVEALVQLEGLSYRTATIVAGKERANVYGRV